MEINSWLAIKLQMIEANIKKPIIITAKTLKSNRIKSSKVKTKQFNTSQ